MKRKFSFLAPLRIPSKAEHRALKAHLESHEFGSPLSPPQSPFINRRELDSTTEAQLKAACAAIAKGYTDEPEPKLNFMPMHQTKSVPHLPVHDDTPTSRSHTSKQVDTKPQPAPAVYHPKRAVSGSKSAQDLRQVHNAPRQDSSRGAHASLQPEPRHRDAHVSGSRSNTVAPISPYRPKTAPIEESDGSYATPRTGSTDRPYDNTSTAFTSTAITPSKPLQRFSSQKLYEQAASNPVVNNKAVNNQAINNQAVNHQAVKEAAEQAESWMKQQLRRHVTQSSGASQSHQPESRSSSRSWSFRRAKKDPVRPKTAVEAWPTRKDSVDRGSADTGRSSTSHGHAAFGMQQKLSLGTLGITSTSQDQTRASLEGTHFESPKQASNLNLNRALPPLPRLETWNGNHDAVTVYSEPTPTTSSGPKTHIANLMKANSLHAAPTGSPLRARQVQSQQILTLKEESQGVASNIGKPRSVGHSKTSSGADSCLSPTSPSRAPSGNLSHTTIPEDGLPPLKSPAASHHTRRSDATATSIGSRPSLNRGDGPIPNFSRKISIDLQGAIRAPHGPEVTALPQIPQQKVSSLRRVLSKLDLISGSSKRNHDRSTVTWMDHFEAEGIKTGILVPRGPGPTTAPIVRY